MVRVYWMGLKLALTVALVVSVTVVLAELGLATVAVPAVTVQLEKLYPVAGVAEIV